MTSVFGAWDETKQQKRKQKDYRKGKFEHRKLIGMSATVRVLTLPATVLVDC